MMCSADIFSALMNLEDLKENMLTFPFAIRHGQEAARLKAEMSSIVLKLSLADRGGFFEGWDALDIQLCLWLVPTKELPLAINMIEAKLSRTWLIEPQGESTPFKARVIALRSAYEVSNELEESVLPVLVRFGFEPSCAWQE